MNTLLRFYKRFSVLSSKFQTPFLLAVRLYWGWQFAQTGWGKLHHLDKITSFSALLTFRCPASPLISCRALSLSAAFSDFWIGIEIYLTSAGRQHACSVLDTGPGGIVRSLFRSWKVLCRRSVYLPVRLVDDFDIRSWIHFCGCAVEKALGKRAVRRWRVVSSASRMKLRRSPPIFGGDMKTLLSRDVEE